MPFSLQLTPSDGSAPQALSVPTQWADVTLAQFVDLQAPAPEEARSRAEILCSLPAGYLGDLAANDVGYLVNLLEFSNDPSPVMELLPTPGLPDVGGLPYGALMLAQQAIGDAERDFLAYGSPLSMTKVDACEAALLAAPVTESYADLSHFLQACRKWSPGMPPPKKTESSPTKKNSKPTMRALANASGRFSAWIRRLTATS